MLVKMAMPETEELPIIQPELAARFYLVHINAGRRQSSHVFPSLFRN
jgi:hypothetical protein